MSILGQVFGTQLSADVSYAPWSDFWYTDNPEVFESFPLAPEAAFRVSAVFCAVRILSETVAQVPLIVYRRMNDGGKERASNHPLFDLLHDQPNPWQTSFEWREQMMVALLLRGNAYNLIRPGQRGAVDQLIPLHPDRIKVMQADNDRLVYEYRNRHGETETYNQDEIFHVRGLGSDGITGTSIISLFRQGVRLAFSAEKYGADLFEGDAAVRVVVTHPGTLTDPARQNLRKSISDGIRRSKGTALLEEGVKLEKLSMTAEDAQFLASREFSVEEFARWFNLQPHLLKDLRRASFSNIEEQSLEFVKYTMLPWYRRIEQAIKRDLIIAPQTFFAEFLVDGLLRADIKSRYEAYGSAIDHGWMTRNEARVMENKNPLPGLDQPLQQLNMSPANQQQAQILEGVANMLFAKEINALQRSYERRVLNHDNYDGFAADVEYFYVKHTVDAARYLAIDAKFAAPKLSERHEQIREAAARERKNEIVSVRNVIAEFTRMGPAFYVQIAQQGVPNDNNGEGLQPHHSGGRGHAVGDPRREAIPD